MSLKTKPSLLQIAFSVTRIRIQVGTSSREKEEVESWCDKIVYLIWANPKMILLQNFDVAGIRSQIVGLEANHNDHDLHYLLSSMINFNNYNYYS